MDGDQNNMDGNGNGSGSAGPIIGIVIILAIVILGALYFWGQRSGTDEMMNGDTVQNIETQSDSDETSAIEEDLNQTDVEIIDVEVNAS